MSNKIGCRELPSTPDFTPTINPEDIRVKRDKLGGIVGRFAPYYPDLSWFPTQTALQVFLA